MQFFLDTGNLDEIRTGAAWGILDGVTTNPTLVGKEGMDHRALIREIAGVVAGPISVETTSDRAEEMVTQGREYVTWAPNVIVKVPCTPQGIKAATVMRGEGIRTNVTLVFSLNQAVLAAKVGAYFVSPFLGRLDDIGEDSMILLRDIVQVYRTYDFSTQVLAASLRHPMHVAHAAKAGTEIGQTRFLADWRALHAELERKKTKV